MILKPTNPTSGQRGQTLPEVLVASVIMTLLFASAIGAFMLTKNIQRYSIEEYNLQRDVNKVLARIVRNIKEDTENHGLRSGRSFTIPSVSRLNYAGDDGIARSYYLSSGSILYLKSNLLPSTIYTPPTGSTLTLRFWEPTGYSDHVTVGIYIGITRVVGGKTISGSATTYVIIRNAPR